MIHVWDVCSVDGCISVMPNASVRGTWIQE
jgi:hypothetical protein